MSFHPCIVGDTQIILGDRHLNGDDLSLIREAKVILLPQGCSPELYRACRNGAALLFPDYRARFDFPGKTGQALLFKKMKCPHPGTMSWPSVEKFREAFGEFEDLPHGKPFLIKTGRGHEAEGVYVISDREDLETCLEGLSRAEKEGSSGFISQVLIPSQGNVLRTVILGRNIITYWKRPGKSGQVITTISHGARIDKTWRPELQEKGRIKAREFSALSGIDLAAIDMVFSLTEPEPQPFFLEINYYFGRRGLGGSLNYYRLLFEAVQEWLAEKGLDPNRVTLA